MIITQCPDKLNIRHLKHICPLGLAFLTILFNLTVFCFTFHMFYLNTVKTAQLLYCTPHPFSQCHESSYIINLVMICVYLVYRFYPPRLLIITIYAILFRSLMMTCVDFLCIINNYVALKWQLI